MSHQHNRPLQTRDVMEHVTSGHDHPESMKNFVCPACGYESCDETMVRLHIGMQHSDTPDIQVTHITLQCIYTQSQIINRSMAITPARLIARYFPEFHFNFALNNIPKIEIKTSPVSSMMPSKPEILASADMNGTDKSGKRNGPFQVILGTLYYFAYFLFIEFYLCVL